jgi:hypothetical protein
MSKLTFQRKEGVIVLTSRAHMGGYGRPYRTDTGTTHHEPLSPQPSGDLRLYSRAAGGDESH